MLPPDLLEAVEAMSRTIEHVRHCRDIVSDCKHKFLRRAPIQLDTVWRHHSQEVYTTDEPVVIDSQEVPALPVRSHYSSHAQPQ